MGDAFVQACKRGEMDAVRRFLAEGADPNTVADGRPALYVAAWQGHVNVVELLLEWREALATAWKPFRWNETNYVEHMLDDVSFLQRVPVIVESIGAAVLSNVPFLHDDATRLAAMDRVRIAGAVKSLSAAKTRVRASFLTSSGRPSRKRMDRSMNPCLGFPSAIAT